MLSSGWQRLILCATFRGCLQTPMLEWLLKLRKVAEPRAGSVLPDGCGAAPAILPWCLRGHRHGRSDLAKHVVLRAAAVTVITECRVFVSLPMMLHSEVFWVR